MDGFSDLIYLLPEQRVGLYVACNTEAGGFGLAGAVKDGFLDHYFPAQAQPVIQKAKARGHNNLERFIGKYRWDIYCHTCPAAERGFFPEAFDVTLNPDGTINAFGGKWEQVEPLLFRSIDGSDLLAFRADRTGQIVYLFHDTWAFERVAGQRQ
jgi:hypothetical protein